MYTVMIAEDEEIYRRALTVFVEWENWIAELFILQ